MTGSHEKYAVLTIKDKGHKLSCFFMLRGLVARNAQSLFAKGYLWLNMPEAFFGGELRIKRSCRQHFIL